MKKNIKLVFLFIFPFLILGCNVNNESPYEGYKHYDLKDKTNIGKYDYKEDTYVIADISDNKTVGYNGLFYKVGMNDYILIDKFEVTPGYTAGDYMDSEYSFFKENKLYIVRNLGTTLLEYTLNKENTEQRDLIFDMSDVYNQETEHLAIYSIKDVNEDYILYSANIRGQDSNYITLKCSLKELVCEVY